MELSLPFWLKPSSLIVFEGLDDTGKTTQMRAMQEGAENDQFGEPLFDPIPYFTHQPSGSGRAGRMIYKITERHRELALDPLALQLLHLASHAQHWTNDIVPRLEGGTSVFMDRCWWSTYAYGFDALAERFKEDEILRIIQAPAQGYKPDLVFLFLHTYADNPNNSLDLRMRYQKLQRKYDHRTVLVPDASPQDVTLFIFQTLRERGFTNGYK